MSFESEAKLFLRQRIPNITVLTDDRQMLVTLVGPKIEVNVAQESIDRDPAHMLDSAVSVMQEHALSEFGLRTWASEQVRVAVNEQKALARQGQGRMIRELMSRLAKHEQYAAVGILQQLWDEIKQEQG